MSDDLDGATEAPAENTVTSTAGEFAARWNAAPAEERDRMFGVLRSAMDLQIRELTHGATEREEQRRAVADLIEALRLTVEYVGTNALPARAGWTWFDALKRHAPAVAEHFVDHPIPLPWDAPLAIYDRRIRSVRTFAYDQNETCQLPAPRLGEVCSLPLGHDGLHAVEVLALVTIDCFTSDLENTMQDPETPDDAAQRRSQHAKPTDKPRSPRSKPTPRDVRPHRKDEQR